MARPLRALSGTWGVGWALCKVAKPVEQKSGAADGCLDGVESQKTRLRNRKISSCWPEHLDSAVPEASQALKFSDIEIINPLSGLSWLELSLDSFLWESQLGPPSPGLDITAKTAEATCHFVCRHQAHVDLSLFLPCPSLPLYCYWVIHPNVYLTGAQNQVIDWLINCNIRF